MKSRVELEVNGIVCLLDSLSSEQDGMSAQRRPQLTELNAVELLAVAGGPEGEVTNGVVPP